MLPAPALPATAENAPRSAPPRQGVSAAGAASALEPSARASRTLRRPMRTALRYPFGAQAREPVDRGQRRESPPPDEREPHCQRSPDHNRRDGADQRRGYARLERPELVRCADEDHL